MTTLQILLVEDNGALCEVVQRNLTARGYTVALAPDAQTALDFLRAHVVDLLILDINLPDRTGWDILRIARDEQLFQHAVRPGDSLPVVVLSAVRVGPQRLAEFAPLAYLPKPFPLDALLRLVAEANQRKAASNL